MLGRLRRRDRAACSRAHPGGKGSRIRRSIDRPAFVAGDRREPGGRVPWLDAVPDAAVGREERLLGGVLGLVLVAEQHAAEAKHRRPVTLEDLGGPRRGRPVRAAAAREGSTALVVAASTAGRCVVITAAAEPCDRCGSSRGRCCRRRGRRYRDHCCPRPRPDRPRRCRDRALSTSSAWSSTWSSSSSTTGAAVGSTTVCRGLGLRPGCAGLAFAGFFTRGLRRGVGRALVLRRNLGRGGPGRRQDGEGDERGREQQKAPHDSPFRSNCDGGFV